MSSSSAFYSDAERYWASIEATDAGMMGGNDRLDEIELQASREFLSRARDLLGLRQLRRAIDCGCGIGRVTKKLLLPLFESVDMAEVTQHFLEQSKDYIGHADFARVGQQFNCGLQSLQLQPAAYDVVWVQWVIGHLSDLDLVTFLETAAKSLTDRGCICIKDNVITARDDDEYDFDDTDSSYCRPKRPLLRLFAKAGVKVIFEEKQKRFPQSLYPVLMFAIVPCDRLV